VGGKTQLKVDVAEIKRALAVLFTPGDVVELRALDVHNKTHAGYFSDFERLASEAAALSGQAAGVYVVLNRINPDLLARSQNRITIAPRNLTQDSDITLRRWLPVDIDARRPSGISSTDREHAAAIAAAKNIKDFLISEFRFPQDSVILGDSGNGAHILVRIELPNDAEAEAIVKACLKAIAARFDSGQVSIDLSVFNAARIWKLPGTLARKGDSTSDRPHRIARLLDIPSSLDVAPVESLQALAATAPEPEAPKRAARTRHDRSQPLDIGAWLEQHGIEIKRIEPYKDGTRYILKSCPFNPGHTGTSAAVFQAADGALGFKCQHNSCSDKTWADLRKLKEPGYRDRKNGHHEYQPDNTLPLIVVGNRQLRDLTADGLKALEEANSPTPNLFRFGPGLARIGHDDHHRPFTEQANETIIRYHLGKAATFIRYDTEGNAHNSLPPLDLCRNILVAGEDWSFPSLSGIVEAPTLRPDFTVISTPGYDAKTGLYFEPSRGLKIPPVPEHPTDGELQDAVDLVQEPLCDFLFVDQPSRANMTAAILLTCLRDAIPGPVPLTLVTKPQPGCGGSLSIDSVAIIATGWPAHVTQAPTRDPEEWGKLLTSLLLSGERYIIFDNVDHTLESEKLASFLTTMDWKARILGQSETIHLQNRTICFVNGNNCRVGGNLARRIVPVLLDSPQARPWLRDTGKFKHPKLKEWVAENRGRIIAAILTIVRGWVDASKPDAPDAVCLGSFESYSHIMSSLLSFMGIKGFLGNLDDLYEKLDADTPVWANFFSVWLNELGPEPITVADLVSRLKDNASLREALPEIVADWESKDGIAKGYTRRLGNQLAKREGQKFDNGLTLTRAGEKWRKILWQVVSFENETHKNLASNVSFVSFNALLRGEKSEQEYKENKECRGRQVNSPNSQMSVENVSLVPEVLGMTIDRALEIWRRQGTPVIHLSQGVNCLDLEKLLSRSDTPPEHLEAVKTWLQEHKGGEQC